MKHNEFKVEELIPHFVHVALSTAILVIGCEVLKKLGHVHKGLKEIHEGHKEIERGREEIFHREGKK